MLHNPPVSNIKHLIELTNLMVSQQHISASTGEQIAVAFILNDMRLLPNEHSDVVYAWERLGYWQSYVKLIKQDYWHMIEIDEK